MGLEYIISWTEKVLVDLQDEEFTHIDHYQPFEHMHDAVARYEVIRDLDECYVATLSCVLHSTDYDVHPLLKELSW